jgi:hypothetical protein
MRKTPLFVVLVGVDYTEDFGYAPIHDVFNPNMSLDRPCARATGGYRYATLTEAADAGDRATKYVETHGMFPNMCERF